MYRMFTLIWAAGVVVSASHAQAVMPMGDAIGSVRTANVSDGQTIKTATLTGQEVNSTPSKRVAKTKRSSRAHTHARSKVARNKRSTSRRATRTNSRSAVYAYRSRRVTADGSSAEKMKPKRKVAARKSRRGRSVPAGTTLTGMASYYWQPQRVASGGWFNPKAMTAAHKTLPFGTRVRVTNARNGRSVDVTINDRGPYVAGRIIDLSDAAAGAIGMKSAGVAPVKVEVLGD